MRYLTLIFLLFAAVVASAQKLPNNQEASVWAPANIKIDGKANEWDNQFQAYNKAMDVSYTIANDNDNLYLAIQATDRNVINTIAGYGFTFVIQKRKKKDEKDKITIAYPVYNEKNKIGNILPTNSQKGVVLDTSAGIAEAYNKLLEHKFKTIIVTGVAGLDTLSVYNENGIKAVGLFDKYRIYTLEIAMPLKYMGISTNNNSKFAYHMIVNGYKAPEHYTMALPKDATPEMKEGMQQAVEDLNLRIAKRNPSTDFWGEYTLAKVP